MTVDRSTPTLDVVAVVGPDAGHALPVLGLMRSLRARGHRTTVITGTQQQHVVEAEGHRFIELPLLAPTTQDADFGHRLWTRAGQMAPPLRALIVDDPLDVLVVDTLTTVGGLVADLLERPWVEVVPHHLVDPDPLVPPIGLGLPPATTRERRRSDATIRRAQRESLAEGAALRDAVRADLGLGPPIGPACRLLQTVPALEPPRTRWPAHTHVVGQLAIDPPLPPLGVPAGTGPLVVVTETTASGAAAAAEHGLGARVVADVAGQDLGAGPVRVVVTGDARSVAAVLDEQRAPHTVVGRGPHGPLLDLASVAVGPGGGGFLTKALARGVPLVVAPGPGDQREAAGRVSNAGLGVSLHEIEGAGTMRAAVERILGDPRFAEEAAATAAAMAELGPDRAARLVEQVVG